MRFVVVVLCAAMVMAAGAGEPVVGRVAVIGLDQVSQASAVEVLDDLAGEVRFVALDHLEELWAWAPDLVVITSDTRSVWREVRGRDAHSVFGRHKLVGLGRGGVELFRVLGSNLGGIMHSRGDYAIELVRFPTGMVERPPLPRLFQVNAGSMETPWGSMIGACRSGSVSKGSPAGSAGGNAGPWRDRGICCSGASMRRWTP